MSDILHPTVSDAEARLAHFDAFLLESRQSSSRVYPKTHSPQRHLTIEHYLESLESEADSSANRSGGALSGH